MDHEETNLPFAKDWPWLLTHKIQQNRCSMLWKFIALINYITKNENN